MTERHASLKDQQRTLYAAADILYWLLANNPPHSTVLYWTQLQWDECNDIREALKRMANRMTKAPTRRPTP